jgi:hypothetical protein
LWCAHVFKRQQPETGASKQNTSKTFSRLVKTISAFEKVVPCGRPTKQLQSPAKVTRPNKTTQEGMQQVMSIHPMMSWYFSPAYSSRKYFPVQAWGSVAMNQYYMIIPFLIRA